MAMDYAPFSSFHSPLTTLDALTMTYQLLSVLPLHYIVLCVFIPPSLSFFSNNHAALKFEGGPAQVGMILDWRELGSRRTFDWSPLGEDFLSWRKGVDKEVLLSGLDQGDREAAKHWKMGSVWLGDIAADARKAKAPYASPPVVIDARQILRPEHSVIASALGGGGSGRGGSGSLDAEALEQIKGELADATGSAGTAAESDLEQWEWNMTRDPSRGWAIAGAWAVACAMDVFLLTTVVRRPKHILDHVVTLHLVHLLLTSWYSSSIPTSLFWWLVMLAHATACVVWAERVAIRTEMRKSVGYGLVGSGETVQQSDMDAGQQHQQQQDGLRSGGGTERPHVLFDQNAEEDEEEADDKERSKMINKPTMPFSAGGHGGENGSKRSAHGSNGHGESIPMQIFPMSSTKRS